MNRQQLEHAIRAATTIVAADKIIVIGSQSILGSYNESELPQEATESLEVDLWPLGDDDAQTLARKLAYNGELSDFHLAHGYYMDGVGAKTPTLPAGWEDRLVEFPAQRLDGVRVVGLCLEPHDVCVAKLVANREKDRRFVGALVDAGLVQPEIILERLALTTPPLDQVETADGIELRERDLNPAWVTAQYLAERRQQAAKPNPTIRPAPVQRRKTSAKSTAGSFAPKHNTEPPAGLSDEPNP